MTNFEDELRSALRRENPPAGFANRVLERTSPRAGGRPHWAAWAVAASLLLSMGGVEYKRRQDQGQRAKQQLLLALDITSSKLALAQKRVTELSQRTIHD